MELFASADEAVVGAELDEAATGGGGDILKIGGAETLEG